MAWRSISLSPPGLVLVLACALAGGCRESPAMGAFASPGNPRTSPSGKYVLVVFDTSDGTAPVWGFRVEAASGGTLAAPPERLSQRHRTYLLWDAADRVWAYSGDVGTFYWERDADGWRKHAWVDGGAAAPPELTALVPQLDRKR